MKKSEKNVNPSYSVIIPNYNGSSFLKECCISLIYSLSKLPNPKIEIILVDNASIDDSIRVFKDCISKKYPYQILKNVENKGFAIAINQGILASKYEYVVLLNNDLIIDKQFFVHIDKRIRNNLNPKVVTFHGTILNKEGNRYESQGLSFDYSGKCKNISHNKKFNLKIFNKYLAKNSKKNIFTWGASAALIIYRKDIFNKVGLFDPDFFAYEEDVDLSLRLSKLKYKSLYVPNALSYHLGGGTSKKMGIFKYKMDAKNWFYIIIKNYSFDDISTNFFKIIEERLRNLSGLCKQTIKIYKLKSLYLLPFILISTYGEVLLKIPIMLKKRHY